MTDPVLLYADLDQRRPTEHSRLAMISILMYAAVAGGKVTVWLYGCYRWQKLFRAERLYDRVVRPYSLPLIAAWICLAGALFALTAILIPKRKRALAVFAFVVNFLTAVYLFNEELWGFALSRVRE